MTKYVEILFRHRLRFLLLIFILPAELAVACVFLFPHQTAVSSMWVEPPPFIVTQQANGWNAYLTPAQNTIDALDQLRSTDSFGWSLRTSLDATNTFQSASERDSVLATVTADTVVTASGSHLVVLTYTCPHEPICTRVLSATEQIYHQWLVDRQTEQAKVAIDFYTGQVAIAQAKQKSDEAALSDYLAAHPQCNLVNAPLIPECDQLIRNVNNDKATVAGFQQKLDDTKLTNAAFGQLDTTVLRVVDPPRAVGGRLNALPKKQMTIAVIASLALAAAVLLIMVWSDRSTREPRDIEGRLRIPVVATIPDLALMASPDG